ncbi:MAG TPA: efflux RND transporter periplasmic adaptor subunit [Bacteroidota bacterium]|nr:efflux RND transporter periplasmic adaptor subunit [Bacteroidota bacterium]
MNRKLSSLLIGSALVLLAGCSNNHKGTLEASGTLEATEVRISTKVPGQIERLLVQEGSSVKAGDTLAVLDHSTLEFQWKQAEAGVELADAQYKLLVNGARAEDLQSAEEAVTQSQSSFENARTDFGRMKELFATHTVSQKQMDDAQSRYTIAEAQLNSAQQNLKKLKRFARPEDLAAAKARLSQAQANAGLLKKQMNDSYVISPVSGIVTQKPVEVGELLGTGTTVVSIAQLEKLNLMIYVNEAELGKIKLGGTADVVIDTNPNETHQGKIVYISPIAEFTPKNVQTKEDRTKLVFGVKVEVANPNTVLKAGMPADAYVHTQE